MWWRRRRRRGSLSCDDNGPALEQLRVFVSKLGGDAPEPPVGDEVVDAGIFGAAVLDGAHFLGSKRVSRAHVACTVGTARQHDGVRQQVPT